MSASTRSGSGSSSSRHDITANNNKTTTTNKSTAAANQKHNNNNHDHTRIAHPPLTTTASGIAHPRHRPFDPWNSAATGHQRADGNALAGSTAWRASRTAKLAARFGGGAGGGPRVADAVGAGSEAFGRDGRLPHGGWVRGASGLRGPGQRSLVEVWGGMAGGKGKGRGKPGGERAVEGGGDGVAEASSLPREPKKDEKKEDHTNPPSDTNADAENSAPPSAQPPPPSASLPDPSTDQPSPPPPPQIFAHLTFHLSGSTHPYISDHRLKQLLIRHGGALSLAPLRSTVTHVIVGRPAAGAAGGGGGVGGGIGGGTPRGVGGGLAANKLQREIQRAGRAMPRFVSAEWAVRSVAAGRRLPERDFAPVHLAGPRQRGAGRMEGFVRRA